MTYGYEDDDSGASDYSYITDYSDGDEIKKLQKLAVEETWNVRSWRRIVLAVLFLVSAIVVACTFVFLGSKEEASFEESFRLMTETIQESINAEFRETSGVIRDFSNVLSAHTHSSEEDGWPRVTLPDFEAFAKQTRIQIHGDAVAFSPLVNSTTLELWNSYSVEKQSWIKESFDYIGENGIDIEPVPPVIYRQNETGNSTPKVDLCLGSQSCAPLWQLSRPPKDTSIVNFNTLSYSEARGILATLNLTRDVVLGKANGQLSRLLFPVNTSMSTDGGNADVQPRTSLAYPVFDLLPEDPIFPTSRIVGIAWSVFPWDIYLRNRLPRGTPGVDAVLVNNCGQSFTYLLEGTEAIFRGEGDLHDPDYDSLRVNIEVLDAFSVQQHSGGCRYAVSVYPTSRLADSFDTKTPMVFTLIVSGALAVIMLTFFVYDAFVRKKDTWLIKAAARSNKLVSSLFPSNVRDRVLPKLREGDDDSVAMSVKSTHKNLRAFMNGGVINSEGDDEDFMYKTKPIADLFPEATIVFADLVGFTAWSSVREPSQVFTLLETIYGAFDAIAKRRRVFKVETIGDCYVAVTGLPEPRKDHALAMARFALDSLRKMSELTKNLETTLGPDTADLSMRFGLHSGPVTAGVLRGDRARFQLFGDTMNMASTMESCGVPGRIQLSQETADQLVASGKQDWVKKREDVVDAKGKGELQTYWLVSTGDTPSRSSGSGQGESARLIKELVTDDWDDQGVMDDAKVLKLMSEKTDRLVNWNVEVLSNPLKQIAAHREQENQQFKTPAENLRLSDQYLGANTLDEVKEIIALPKFDPKASHVDQDTDSVELDAKVTSQLRDFVQTVASLYHDNAFHNFEHASHVTMSTVKLLSRIVGSPNEAPEAPTSKTASMLHANSHGITSDPLTQFACIFSALIHDVDHSGVSNAQLVKENSHIAALYRGKSVAEQNSVDLAWDLLFSPEFNEMRAAIYQTESELRRFRQLVVNSVMATDILDRDLKALRNARWDRAFSERPQREAKEDTVNRKATIVIEHLIQASDVSHTMQHWHVYRKWNECLFEEQVNAFLEGRGEKNPAINWYEGEIGFFDYYIIPLAKKLKDCGVFGVSSDEYLNYAMKNRSEWEAKGREVVEEMVQNLESKREAKLS